MNFDWLTNDTKEIIVTAGLGSAMGTLWRAVTRPETIAMRFITQAVVSITVGTVIGGALIQYLHLTSFIAAGVAATAAYLAEEVLKFMQVRGAKLERGDIGGAIKGDENE